ncbi:MAG: imidazole glycerol phosphate synthase subunit HisH [Rhodospirillaceae bacterium TMED167]|nr:imidazole glycerol phosphate synthase subunit HisH [Rhodospirillaceae bacterium]OUW27096.1 MAG: imidazole glycerol phosphate synthase subunit HisH [Rhodospirillaceae bacterium TMED167]
MVPAVAIIDYGSGNLRSAAKALERAASELGGTVTITADPTALTSASHIVLPGVGAFADCREGLAAVDGMIDALTEQVYDSGKPFLGICVGMQLMAERGLEHGDTPGFGWIAGEVVPITLADPTLKIPHMGWNNLSLISRSHPVLARIEDGAHAYFVHSYHVNAKNPSEVLAETDHGGPVTAIVGRDNLIGTQFHPEKSQHTGLQFIQSFMKWRP